MLPSLHIFGWEVGSYGIMVVLGAFVCATVGTKMIKRFGRDLYDFLLILLCIGAGIFVGAHILFGITHLDTLILAFRNIRALWFNRFWDAVIYSIGGMVFYGGFLGGIGAIFIYSHFDKKIKARNLLDIYAVLTPLFHVFGRIGCFLGGCCYGIESPFGFTAHGNTINPDVNDVNRLPVQLIEATCNLMIFLFILYLFRKSRMTDKLIFVYMLIYPVVRFTLEFFRGDEIRGFLFGLSTSQWISILLFAVAVAALLISH
ncbi:MAG: prolipoprotein diacylglyceryl transferase, partial [Ruminococcus sp.]|nr:prolipoprotein diacylglyceryl transferase [Ruminococcus sp.]